MNHRAKNLLSVWRVPVAIRMANSLLIAHDDEFCSMHVYLPFNRISGKQTTDKWLHMIFNVSVVALKATYIMFPVCSTSKRITTLCFCFGLFGLVSFRFDWLRDVLWLLSLVILFPRQSIIHLLNQIVIDINENCGHFIRAEAKYSSQKKKEVNRISDKYTLFQHHQHTFWPWNIQSRNSQENTMAFASRKSFYVNLLLPCVEPWSHTFRTLLNFRLT